MTMINEPIGPNDWAYGHNRLTYPGESSMQYQFTIAKEKLLENPASQVIVKLNYFAPW